MLKAGVCTCRYAPILLQKSAITTSIAWFKMKEAAN